MTDPQWIANAAAERRLAIELLMGAAEMEITKEQVDDLLKEAWQNQTKEKNREALAASPKLRVEHPNFWIPAFFLMTGVCLGLVAGHVTRAGKATSQEPRQSSPTGQTATPPDLLPSSGRDQSE